MSVSAPPPPSASPVEPEGDSPAYQQGVFRRLLIGPPIETRHQEETHLPKRLALPIFASDAISSVAYATQEILLALGAAGYAAASYAAIYGQYIWGVTFAIVALLGIVVFSYRQTIFAYPNGGGSYIVTKDNLGAKPGLIAAAALLIDYVLTVSVSIAAGTQNLLSTPFFARFGVSPEAICLLFIALLTLANLRGLKESGKVFALPTYIFIVLMYLMLGVGLIGPLLGWHLHTEALDAAVPIATHPSAGTSGLGALGILVALRAFANGCSAMTGTEAISDGIPAFRKPQSQNAATTLTWMAVILATLFLGISALAAHLHIMYGPHDNGHSPAVIDQISGAVWGRTGPFSFLYYAVQLATGAILVLAANTSFVDFPRLASILANDRYLPKELAHRGDRLVFGRGIVVLGLFAALLIIVFKGSVDRLIPLYALGVFTAFTLSQTAMVRRWAKERGPGWSAKAVVNGIGAVATCIVFSVILIEKAPEGAWAVVVMAALLTAFFTAVHKRYEVRQRGLAFDDAPFSASEMGTNEHGPGTSARIADASHPLHPEWINTRPIVTAATPMGNGTKTKTKGMPLRNMPAAPVRNTVIVLVPGVHKGIMPAINYARLIGRDIRPVYIEIDPELTSGIRAEWQKHVPDIPLIVKESPYRSLVQPLLTYIDKVTDEFDDDVVTLIIPESFSGNLLDTLLRSTAATQIKLALLGREDVVVTNVRYRLSD